MKRLSPKQKATLRAAYEAWSSAHLLMHEFLPGYNRDLAKKKLMPATLAHKNHLSMLLRDAYATLRDTAFLAGLFPEEMAKNQEFILDAVRNALRIPK